MTTPWTVPATDGLTLTWLVRLRWAAVAGQLAAVTIADRALRLDVPLGSLLGLVAVGAVSNLVLLAWRQPPGWVVPALLVGDTLLLTALLALSGGPSNPFSALYLVHVALAAVTLGPAWTWTVAGVAGVAYALLFFVGDLHLLHRGGTEVMQGHLLGMWLALVLTGGAISAFVAQLAAGIRARDEQLLAERQRAGRAERLAAMGTLAAGAAHELGSPLGVILVAAEDAEPVARRAGQTRLAEEFATIRAQVERCRAILSDLAGRAGEPRGEAPEVVPLAALAEAALASLNPDDAGRVRVEGADERRFALPRRTATRVLASLLRNALAAGEGTVDLRLSVDRDGFRAVVVDRGVGMDPATLARAGDPFFTTRPPGEGQGLGLFVARGFAESLGGGLRIASEAGRGTTVTLHLPGTAA